MSNIKKIKPNGLYKNGLFEPRNPDKYVGDIHNIIYRSSWEYRFCKYCDNTESIIKWSSEPIGIDYYNPLDKKEHVYHVDFYMKVVKEDNTEQDWIIEIKPENQTKKPVYVGSITEPKLKSYNRNMGIWITNQSKFKAAKIWAEKRDFRFGVIDENFLFNSI
jgi:glutaredoxin